MTPIPSEHHVAVVTGAAQGVGRAVAELFAQRGAALLLTDRDGEALDHVVAELSGVTSVVPVVADLTSVGATERIVQRLENAGPVDVLVNAAGHAPRGSLLDTSIEDWDRALALNLRAPFQLMRGVGRAMVAAGRTGAIVNVGSINAHGGETDLCAYSAAKGGLVTLTRNAAYALLPHRVRVNVVNFGWMRTPGEIDSQASYYGHDEAWLDAAAAGRPFRRLITTEEAARVIVFLATAESGVMTGASLDYDQSVAGAGPPAVPTSFPGTNDETEEPGG